MKRLFFFVVCVLMVIVAMIFVNIAMDQENAQLCRVASHFALAAWGTAVLCFGQLKHRGDQCIVGLVALALMPGVMGAIIIALLIIAIVAMVAAAVIVAGGEELVGSDSPTLIRL